MSELVTGWPGLPILVTVKGRAIILVGTGEAADAKRRLLERAGARVVAEAADEGAPPARLAVVAVEDEAAALAAVARLRARGLLVNAVDRPASCDFTLPAIVDRAPLLVAIATGGASAGLAAALRQRIELLLPPGLGALADRLRAGRGAMRARWPGGGDRRRALAAALAPGAPLDPLVAGAEARIETWLANGDRVFAGAEVSIRLRSADPDDLTLREARWLANADRVCHERDVPAAILDRARADADRLAEPAAAAPAGLTVRIALGETKDR